VKSTVETLSPTRVRLAIEVPFDELEPSLRKAYREIGAQVSIPGFRKGKVPPAIIDQRVGRSAVLTEAVQDVIPGQFLAAVREHEVRTLGRPEVAITDYGDGQPLRFTAEVDVRPEITVPPLEEIEVTVDAIEVSDDDVEVQLNALRERFATLKTVERAALTGDYAQLDLAATVDGNEVPGGTATNISHEVGSGQLLAGLDEVLTGLSAGGSTSFRTSLVAGDLAGREAEVAVTVRAVKEKQLPPLDADFAQLASEFDSLDELRADLRSRLTRTRRAEQLFLARDKALKALVEVAEVPAPEGVVREEVEHQLEAMADQLERAGSSLQAYLSAEEKSQEQLDAELTERATEAIRVQLLLDRLADVENLQVTEEELLHEIQHRAQRSGVPVQQYYEQLVRARMDVAVAVDVRRGKALQLAMRRVKITDSNGAALSLDDLRGESDEAAEPDEHQH
jgi:trigger factor